MNITRRGILTGLAGIITFVGPAMAKADPASGLIDRYNICKAINDRSNKIRAELFPDLDPSRYRNMTYWNINHPIDLEYSAAYDDLCGYFYAHANFPVLTNDSLITQDYSYSDVDKLRTALKTGDIGLFFSVDLPHGTDTVERLTLQKKLDAEALGNNQPDRKIFDPVESQLWYNTNVGNYALIMTMYECQTNARHCMFVNPNYRERLAAFWNEQSLTKLDHRGIMNDYMEFRVKHYSRA